MDVGNAVAFAGCGSSVERRAIGRGLSRPTAIVLGAAMGVSGLARGQCVATPVPLQQATATFSQTCNGASTFLVSRVIDANPGTGWAIYQGNCGLSENTFDQTAVFETAADVVPPVPGQLPILEVSIFSGFLSGTSTPHTLGLFRLSVTGDPRTTFADGLAAGGDVTANWVVLTPQSLTAVAANSSGISIPGPAPVLSMQPDGSILAQGPSPEYARYVVRAPSPLAVVTGLRLEVIDANGASGTAALGLPTGGPGRAVNGNFILYELTMASAPCVEVCTGPAPAIACPGGPATFSVTGAGVDPLSYQWRKDSTPIDAQANPSAATAILALTNVQSADIGLYDCIVSSACGSLASDPAALVICIGDFNCDGGIDGGDVESFFAAWEAGEGGADVNADGGIDGADVEFFFGRWENGC